MTRKKDPKDLKRNNPRGRGTKNCPHITIFREWNRKGQQFKECSDCGAFLGFTGQKR